MFNKIKMKVENNTFHGYYNQSGPNYIQVDDIEEDPENLVGVEDAFMPGILFYVQRYGYVDEELFILESIIDGKANLREIKRK